MRRGKSGTLTGSTQSTMKLFVFFSRTWLRTQELAITLNAGTAFFEVCILLYISYQRITKSSELIHICISSP
jgi:hypothetical protein